MKLGAAAWRKAAQLLSVFLSRLLFPPTSYYAASVVSPPLLLLVLSRLLAVIVSSDYFEMISYLSHEKFTLQSTRTLSHTHAKVCSVCVCVGNLIPQAKTHLRMPCLAYAANMCACVCLYVCMCIETDEGGSSSVRTAKNFTYNVDKRINRIKRIYICC